MATELKASEAVGPPSARNLNARHPPTTANDLEAPSAAAHAAVASAGAGAARSVAGVKRYKLGYCYPESLKRLGVFRLAACKTLGIPSKEQKTSKRGTCATATANQYSD